MRNARTHQQSDDEMRWVWVIVVVALLGVLGRFLLGDAGATRVDHGAVGEPTPAAETSAGASAESPR
ncbi:MAG TPA: hypothetical protein VNA89_07150 [Gemmatimonadaceae bacterium]|nr:hypothetical protein [Gemmatimonadaceae bacterium]